MATITGSGDGVTLTNPGGAVSDGGHSGVTIDYTGGGNVDANVSLQGSGADVHLSDGNNTVTVGGDNTSIVGGDGDDQLIIGGGGTTVSGANVDLGGGSNTLGGSNIDDSSISGAGTVVGQLDSVHSSQLDFSGADQVQVTTTGDTNTLQGGSGADSVAASGDNNVVLGGGGDDHITSTGSGGLIGGSTGDKSIDVSGSNNISAGGDGNQNVQLHGGNDTAYGGLGNDTLIGSIQGHDVLHGGGGADWLQGGPDSKLYADAGTDTLVGADGDSLYGGSGAGGGDLFVLHTDFGHETIYGFDLGANHDYVQLDAGGSYTWTGHGAVTIADFADLTAKAAVAGSGVSIAAAAGGVKITIGDSAVVIKGIAIADLSGILKFH